MTPEEIELRRKMADALTAARALHDTATGDNRNLTTDEQSSYDQHMTAARDIQARVTRGAELGGFPDPTGPGASDPEGFGRPASQLKERATVRSAITELIEGDDLARARANGYRGGFALSSLEGVSLKAMMALIDGSGTSGGAFQNPTRVQGDFRTEPDRMLRLIDLIPHGTTGDNSVEYVRDTTTDAVGNTAAETAEGSNLKPETTSTFEVVTDPVKTIAAWLDVTRQSLDDNAQLRTNLEGRLLYRAWRRLDSQIINGDGAGANLLGLLNRPGILTYAPAAAEQRIVSVRKGVTVGEQSDVEYTAVVVNPLDKERYDLSFASGSGEFLSATAPSYMWGLRPVVSNAIAAGTALLVDPNEAMLWDRAAPAIYVTDSDADKFRRNILTMLIDLRAALSLFTPRAALKLTFNGPN